MRLRARLKRIAPVLMGGLAVLYLCGCGSGRSSDDQDGQAGGDGTVTPDAGRVDGSGPGPDAARPDAAGQQEVCDNNVDDDGDGRTDCNDPDCYDTGSPEPSPMTGMTQEHNKIRCNVDPPSGGPLPLYTWSTTLQTYAQNWADQLASENCANIRHSNGQYGENIAWGSGGASTPAQVVGLWASEISCFHYDTFPSCCSCTCGHYTALVWRNTAQVGCGHSMCGSTHVWVCSYNPPGNYMGQYPY